MKGTSPSRARREPSVRIKDDFREMGDPVARFKARSMGVPDVRRSLEGLTVGRFKRAHSDEISIAELAYLVGSEREQRLGSPGSRDELDFHGSQSVNLDDRTEVAAT